MKTLLPLLLGALISSTSSSLLLAQSAKTSSETSNLSPLQYSNIHDYQPQLMMDPEELKSLEAVATTLGLKEFSQAVETHPTTTRLVTPRVEEDLFIQSREVEQNTHSKNQAEIKNFSKEAFLEKLTAQITENAEMLAAAKQVASTAKERKFVAWYKAVTYYEQASGSLKKATLMFDKSLVNSIPPEISTFWRKSSEQYQILADFESKSAEACTRVDDEEETLFKETAGASSSSAEWFERAVYALEKSFASVAQPEVSRLWRKSSEQYQAIAEIESKFAEARIKEKGKAKSYFYRMAYAIWSNKNPYEQAAIALEQSLESSAQPEISARWRKVSEQWQIAAEYEKKAIQAANAGDSDRAEFWENSVKEQKRLAGMYNTVAGFRKEQTFFRVDKAINLVFSGSMRLEEAAQSLEKSLICSFDPELSVLWRKSADQQQELALFYKDAASVNLRERLTSIVLFDKASGPILSSEDCLKKASIALEKSEGRSTSISALWRKLANQQQQLAKFYSEIAKADLSENEEEISRLKKALEVAEEEAQKWESLISEAELLEKKNKGSQN